MIDADMLGAFLSGAKDRIEDGSHEGIRMNDNNNSTSEPTHEEITARAQLIWEQEGKPKGHDFEHWIKAEAQLMEERNKDENRTQA